MAVRLFTCADFLNIWVLFIPSAVFSSLFFKVSVLFVRHQVRLGCGFFVCHCTFKDIADSSCSSLGCWVSGVVVVWGDDTHHSLSSSWELRVVKYSNYSSLVLMRLIIISSRVKVGFKLQCGMKMFVVFAQVWWVLLELQRTNWKKISKWWTVSVQICLFILSPSLYLSLSHIRASVNTYNGSSRLSLLWPLTSSEQSCLIDIWRGEEMTRTNLVSSQWHTAALMWWRSFITETEQKKSVNVKSSC